jgi:hypothetical protein
MANGKFDESELASRHEDTLGTPYVKAQLSLQQPKAYLEKTSNGSADGKATPTIFTSTIFPKSPLSPVYLS